jgi:predicted nucleic-acid-binding protein
VITLDTNVVLRRLLQDDPIQIQKANHLFEQSGSMLLTDIVLVKTVWTLTGEKYNASRQDIGRAVTTLVEEPNVEFEDVRAVWVAYNNFLVVKPAHSKKHAGFADALIAAKGVFVVAGLPQPFNGTYSFDESAQQLPDVYAP